MKPDSQLHFPCISLTWYHQNPAPHRYNILFTSSYSLLPFFLGSDHHWKAHFYLHHGSSSTPALQESPIYGQRIPSAIWRIRKVLKTAQTGIPKHTSANARRDGVCAPEGRICDQRYVKSATTKNTVLTSELEALYFLRRYRHLKRSYSI